MNNKTLKYTENNVVANLKKYLEEIAIIEKVEDAVNKKIKETIILCNDIEIISKEKLDDDCDYLDEDISVALEHFKLTKRCYECAAVILEDVSNREDIDDFNKRISSLIDNEIFKLKVLI